MVLNTVAVHSIRLTMIVNDSAWRRFVSALVFWKQAVRLLERLAMLR